MPGDGFYPMALQRGNESPTLSGHARVRSRIGGDWRRIDFVEWLLQGAVPVWESGLAMLTIRR
jgi:hypothetical protein